MTGFKDIVNFLLPIPPFVLSRTREFPDCAEVFEHISKNPPNPRVLGRRFSKLCGLAGFSWFVWAIDAAIFAAIVVMFLYAWGNNMPMSSPGYFADLSCRMLIAMLTTILFFGQVFYALMAQIGIQLSDRCYEHMGISRPSKKKRGAGK